MCQGGTRRPSATELPKPKSFRAHSGAETILECLEKQFTDSPKFSEIQQSKNLNTHTHTHPHTYINDIGQLL